MQNPLLFAHKGPDMHRHIRWRHGHAFEQKLWQLPRYGAAITGEVHTAWHMCVQWNEPFRPVISYTAMLVCWEGAVQYPVSVHR